MTDDVATEQEALELLASIILYEQPYILVEAGTWRGDFARHIEDYLQLGRSYLYTADTLDAEKPNILGMYFHHMDFEEMLGDHLMGREVNFAFIDSGPPFAEQWEDGVRFRHYTAVQPFMAKNGIIAVHDTNSVDWQGAEQIIAEADFRFKGGRGLTIKRV
jgi:hypothetical protein